MSPDYEFGSEINFVLFLNVNEELYLEFVNRIFVSAINLLGIHRFWGALKAHISSMIGIHNYLTF